MKRRPRTVAVKTARAIYLAGGGELSWGRTNSVQLWPQPESSTQQDSKPGPPPPAPRSHCRQCPQHS